MLNPPRLVPSMVIVCNLTYPVPAVCKEGVYFHPLRITVKFAPTPEPLYVPVTDVYTAAVSPYFTALQVPEVGSVTAVDV